MLIHLRASVRKEIAAARIDDQLVRAGDRCSDLEFPHRTLFAGSNRNVPDGIPRANVARDLPADAIGRIFGLAFALDQISRDLDDLASRAEERTGKRKPPPAESPSKSPGAISRS